jgi:hypothetical protein
MISQFVVQSVSKNTSCTKRNDVFEPKGVGAHPHAQDEETTKQANNKCSAVYTHVIKPWCSDEGKSPNGLCNAELGPVLVLLS